MAIERGAGANEIIFCSYRYDPETELYYVRNRSYNAAFGRWLQRDPIGYAGGINLYGYVMGNSVGSTDPNGQRGQGSSQYIWQGPGTPAPPNSTLPCNDCPPGQQSTTYWQANGYQSMNACVGDLGLNFLVSMGLSAADWGISTHGGRAGAVISTGIFAITMYIEGVAAIACMSQVCH